MLLLAVFSIILGLLLILRGISRLKVRRRLFGSLYWSSGLGMASIGLLFLAAAMNLYTYHRLTAEIMVASVHIKQTAPDSYELLLSEVGREPINFKIIGDEWQLDARFLRWKSWATILGQEPMFRLERLSGRYSDIEQAKVAQRSIYAINPHPGVDVWKLGREYSKWLPFMDAYFGSSVYMPLIADGEYRVTATDSGLMVRAVNAPAKKVLKKW
jgi:hypothetical protein